MQIEGTYTLQAAPEDVWSYLMDQKTIQYALPGLERLTKIDEQTYAFAIQIRHAPLRGTYTGRVTILEQNYPSSYHLHIEGGEQAPTLRGECEMRLATHNENTVVSYQGALQLGRSGAQVPAPQVKATVKMLLQQFFTTLTDQLRTEKGGEPIYVKTLEEMYEMPFMEEQTSEQLRLVRRASPATFLHRLVRLAGLGQQNPALEEQWVRRVRQVGFMALLLLLVWVGTRLPRKAIQ
ncbi:MAG: CoxG family protein [Ktedonobacteraceae bacterium]